MLELERTGMLSMVTALFRRLAPLALLTGFLTASSPTLAQDASKQPEPAKVDQLLTLLGDPEIQSWLTAQLKAAPVASGTGEAAAKASMTASVTRLRRHLAGLVATIPTLPEQIGRAVSLIGAEIGSLGASWMILVFAVFVGTGLVAQTVFWQLARRWRERVALARADTIRERLQASAAKLSFAVTHVVVFALGSLGAFLLFEWPPLLKEILIRSLLAVIAYRLLRVVVAFLLAPPGDGVDAAGDRLRIVPMTGEGAAFWARRILLAAGWFAFGWVVVNILEALEFSRPLQQLAAYLLGVVLVAIGIEAVWRRPKGAETAAGRRSPWLGRRAQAALFSLYFLILWLLWVVSAMRLFWLAVVAVALPGATILARRTVHHLLSPADAEPGSKRAPSVTAAIVERSVRAVLVLAAIFLLATAWGLDVATMASNDTFAVRAIRGFLNAVVIVLLADLAWHATKTLIDQKLASAQVAAVAGSEQSRRNARLRTLLPILRNTIMIVLALVAVLMTLSSIGVEVGPLIAGAGVLGVAIGFGAQTVVKDIISGMFYLLDDAFRVGEYIQSGSYKGTVESFSLRSVKLRHQNGPVFIVPFGELGAVENLSRDWVIEKMSVTVTYDTDIELARKIVKKIGMELASDPEFKDIVIETLKMQGIYNFGDSGIVLRLKLMTRPGEQFTIKRRALLMVKKAFEDNGIKMAFPTVQIAGGSGSEVAAAAQQTLSLARQASAAS